MSFFHERSESIIIPRYLTVFYFKACLGVRQKYILCNQRDLSSCPRMNVKIFRPMILYFTQSDDRFAPLSDMHCFCKPEKDICGILKGSSSSHALKFVIKYLNCTLVVTLKSHWQLGLLINKRQTISEKVLQIEREIKLTII